MLPGHLLQPLQRVVGQGGQGTGARRIIVQQDEHIDRPALHGVEAIDCLPVSVQKVQVVGGEGHVGKAKGCGVFVICDELGPEEQLLDLLQQLAVLNGGITVAVSGGQGELDGLGLLHLGGKALIGVVGGLPPSREGEHHRQGHRRPGGEQGGLFGLGLFYQQGDALLDGLFALGHGGGAGQQVGRPGGPARYHVHQGAAVGQPLVLTQAFDRPLVAGQLAVPFGQENRQPHQGIIPVEGQTQAPQGRPDVVPVDKVGQLVGQDMGSDPVVFGGLRGQVDGGAEQPEQTGGGQTLRHIDGQRAAGQAERAAALDQTAKKMKIGSNQPTGGQNHADLPNADQQFAQWHHEKVVCGVLLVNDNAAGVKFRAFPPERIIKAAFRAVDYSRFTWL